MLFRTILEIPLVSLDFPEKFEMVEKYAIADYVTRKVLHQQVSLETIETWSTHIIILVVPGIFT